MATQVDNRYQTRSYHGTSTVCCGRKISKKSNYAFLLSKGKTGKPVFFLCPKSACSFFRNFPFLFQNLNHVTIIRMKSTRKKGKNKQMQNQQTSQLTQGALMAAVFTVLLAISVYVPLLNVVTTLFLA